MMFFQLVEQYRANPLLHRARKIRTHLKTSPMALLSLTREQQDIVQQALSKLYYAERLRTLQRRWAMEDYLNATKGQ